MIPPNADRDSQEKENMIDLPNCIIETKGMVTELNRRGILAVPQPAWCCVSEGEAKDKTLSLHVAEVKRRAAGGDASGAMHLCCGFGPGRRESRPSEYFGHMLTRLPDGRLLDPRAYRFAWPEIGFTPPRFLSFVGTEFHLQVGKFVFSYYVVEDEDWKFFYDRIEGEVDLDVLERLVA